MAMDVVNDPDIAAVAETLKLAQDAILSDPKQLASQLVARLYEVCYFNFKFRRRLFPFRKQSLRFLTVDATIGNQAHSHHRCNIFAGLSYSKANSTFLSSLRKNNIEVKVEFTFKVMDSDRVTCYSCPSIS